MSVSVVLDARATEMKRVSSQDSLGNERKKTNLSSDNNGLDMMEVEQEANNIPRADTIMTVDQPGGTINILDVDITSVDDNSLQKLETDFESYFESHNINSTDEKFTEKYNNMKQEMLKNNEIHLNEKGRLNLFGKLRVWQKIAQDYAVSIPAPLSDDIDNQDLIIENTLNDSNILIEEPEPSMTVRVPITFDDFKSIVTVPESAQQEILKKLSKKYDEIQQAVQNLFREILPQTGITVYEETWSPQNNLFLKSLIVDTAEIDWTNYEEIYENLRKTLEERKKNHNLKLEEIEKMVNNRDFREAKEFLKTYEKNKDDAENDEISSLKRTAARNYIQSNQTLYDDSINNVRQKQNQIDHLTTELEPEILKVILPDFILHDVFIKKQKPERQKAIGKITNQIAMLNGVAVSEIPTNTSEIQTPSAFNVFDQPGTPFVASSVGVPQTSEKAEKTKKVLTESDILKQKDAWINEFYTEDKKQKSNQLLETYVDKIKGLTNQNLLPKKMPEAIKKIKKDFILDFFQNFDQEYGPAPAFKNRLVQTWENFGKNTFASANVGNNIRGFIKFAPDVIQNKDGLDIGTKDLKDKIDILASDLNESYSDISQYIKKPANFIEPSPASRVAGTSSEFINEREFFIRAARARLLESIQSM